MIRLSCTARPPADWPAFKSEYLRRLAATTTRCREIAFESEKALPEVNPANLMTLSTEHALRTHRDGYANGCPRGNNSTVLAVGPGTAVDALLAVKELVYEKREFTLAELGGIMAANWEGHEKLRQRMLRSKRKWGNNDPEANALGAELLATFAAQLNGKPNSRGGAFLASGHCARQFIVLARPAGRVLHQRIHSVSGVLTCLTILNIVRGVSPPLQFDMPRNVPFTVSRDDTRSLLCQVVDGLREAIVSGFYQPGETVPSYRELAPMLGVSRIVTQAALRRLADEGVVESRPRRGTVVRDRSAKQWRGHVVFVYPQGDVDYFPTLFAEELRLGLNRAGYLFTRASVDRALDGGPCDFSLLDAALSRSVDMAVVFDNRAAIFRHLAARQVPYAAVTHGDATPTGAVGLTRFDYEAAVPHFVSACRAVGIRNAIVLRWDSMMCNAAPALRDAGIAVRTVSVKPDFSCGKHLGVETAGYAGFEKLAKPGQLSPETVVFVTDDYLARGALSAMLSAGLRPPEDFRLAVWSNAGIGPFFPRELSRMETDPRAAGAAAAASALAYLETGRYPDDTAIRPRWIPGETMGK